MHRHALGLVIGFIACTPTIEDDDSFWVETSEDSGGISAHAATGAKVTIDPGRTENAERVKFLPVARTEHDAVRRVVLQLAPPDRVAGDRLITPAEVQVTTRCDVGQNAPGCGYDPNVRAQIILADGPNATNGKVIATQDKTCTSAAHHCMFVFTPSDASVDGAAGCGNNCFLSVVMWAWSPNARANDQDEVIVGGNSGDFLSNHDVDPGHARLMAVRERGITAADRASRQSSGNGSVGLNTSANPVVIYSHELKAGDLVENEQYLIEAKVIARTNARVRVSTYLIVAHSPNATNGSFDPITPGKIGEQNGYNCTAGSSPCTFRKVAVFRVDKAVQGKVYVNVVAKAEVPGGGGANVEIDRHAGWVRSVRYAADLH